MNADIHKNKLECTIGCFIQARPKRYGSPKIGLVTPLQIGSLPGQCLSRFQWILCAVEGGKLNRGLTEELRRSHKMALEVVRERDTELRQD